MADSVLWQASLIIAEEELLVDMQQLGRRLREARERRGLSQYEFADLISRDQRSVSEYERGKRKIAATDLAVLAQVLDVPLSYFYEERLETDGLDDLLLKEFHRVPSEETKRAIINLIRAFNKLNETTST